MKIMIIKVFVIIVLFLFVSTSFAVMADSIVHAPESASIANDTFKNLISNDNGSIEPYVKYTLVLANNTLVKGNFLSANGNGPNQAAFDSSNGYVYVTNFNTNSVSVINGATNTVIANISVGVFPLGVAFDSSNGYVYVTNFNTNSVSVINGATNTVIANISVGVFPLGVAFDSSNGYVYVTNALSGSVSIISTTTQHAAKYAVAFTESGLPSGSTWYVNGSESGSALSGSPITFLLI
ncbi:MAG: YncE family protein [Thermoplasmataceae archaeon]|jgi:YVTN family beta-propeller protein